MIENGKLRQVLLVHPGNLEQSRRAVTSALISRATADGQKWEVMNATTLGDVERQLRTNVPDALLVYLPPRDDVADNGQALNPQYEERGKATSDNVLAATHEALRHHVPVVVAGGASGGLSPEQAARLRAIGATVLAGEQDRLERISNAVNDAVNGRIAQASPAR